MTSSLLMLLLLIKAHGVSSFPSCPSSCVVCSKEAVICQRLTSIIAAPQTTQALLLTEGSISSVQRGALSDLGNITVISLSHNRISALDQTSFRNMPLLQTLLLDHNLLTLQALEGGALTNLTQLEVLALGNNRIDMINSDLFKGTKSLRILKLEGNQIKRLDSGSFPLMGLTLLESLDLSDNLIDYLNKNSFRGLISLKTLDLSRNHLQSAPYEAFSYLTWLNSLNLDLNTWNCSCQLLELTAFLSSFIQEPDKTLYNGRRMVCVSADNPAVTTVLELTEANCVPSNQNITVRVDARGSITPQLYVRDLAITGAVCFAGGVALTLLIVLIYFKSAKKKKRREQQNQEEVKEQTSSTVSTHNRNHTAMTEKRKDFNTGNEIMDAPVGPRTEGNGGHFRCPECRGEEHVPNPVRWDRMNGRVDSLEDRERRRVRVEEETRRSGPQQRIMGRDVMNKHLVGNSLNIEGQNRQDLLHCGSCHRTFRPNQMDLARQAKFPPRGNSSVHNFQQQRPGDWGRTNFYSDFDLRNLKRETRNVTFTLGSPRKGQGEDGESEENASPRGKEGGKDRKDKLLPNRQIKVKLNLNPLRKSKIHPKMKGDEKGSPRKSKDKSGDKEGKKDRRKSKKSKDQKKEKQKKSSEPETVQETVAQIAPQNPMAHMQGFLGPQFRGGGMLLGNRTTNLMGSSGPQLPTSSLPFQAGNLMAQANSRFPMTNPMGPTMNMSGPSMGPGGAPTMGLINSPNLSLVNVMQPNQANLNAASLLASPATRRASIAQASPMALSASANTFQSNLVAASQSNATPLQAGPTLQASPTTSHGNTVVQATTSTKQASPSVVSANTTSQVSNTAKQSSSTTLTANSSSQDLQAVATLAPLSSATPSGAQSELKSSPKSSPRGQSKSVQKPVPQSNSKTNPVANTVTSETSTSPQKGGQTPTGTDSSQIVAPQTTQATTLVKNMSKASLTESIHGEAMAVVTQAELPTGGIMTVGGTQGADVSVSNVHGLTESLENMASTTLIHQEYLSENGGTSPKMKLRLVIPEKTTNRPPTALERKIR